MASAGPAMEVVGRYSRVLDITGEPVDPAHFLVVARRAVRENARVEIDHQPLDTFDARTRFALWWVKLFGKTETAKSELRWQTLADDLDLASVRDLVPDAKKGVIFTDAQRTTRRDHPRVCGDRCGPSEWLRPGRRGWTRLARCWQQQTRTPTRTCGLR